MLGDGAVIIVFVPNAPRHLWIVQDVAQHQIGAGLALLTGQQVERGLQLAIHAERLFVDQNHIRRELDRRAHDQARAKPQRRRIIEVQKLDPIDAVSVAGQAWELHVVDARRHPKCVQHRRPGKDQHRHFGVSLGQRLGDGEHAADVAEAEGVVGINQHSRHAATFLFNFCDITELRLARLIIPAS